MTDSNAGDAPRPLGSGYLLESIIGAGAMGQVWKGATRQGEPVAIKVLRSELASDPAFVARFLQEAQILTRLTDPHLVRVRDLVAENNNLAIVMDLVRGPDLRAELSRRGTFQPADAAAIIDGVLAGLTAVHAADVVHRDIKPENIMLANPETGIDPRLTDFGVSRIVEQGARNTTVIGTPEYIAPEVADGSMPVPASDLYSVGIVLYELLTGVTPFSGGSPLAVMRRHVEQQPGRPEGIPDKLWGVITALLGKSPNQRPKDAPEARGLLATASAELAGLAALSKLDAAPAFVPVNQPTVVGTRANLEQPDYTAAAATRARSTGRRNLIIAVAAAVVVVFAGTAVAVAMSNSKEGGGASTPVAATVTTDPAGVASTESASPSDTATSPATAKGAVPGSGAPSVVGMTLSAATTAIQNAGLQVVTKEVLSTDKADNTVVKQAPVGGAAAPEGTITLTVARQAVGVFLVDMAAVGSSGDSSERSTVTVDGVPYAHAVSTSLSCDDYSSGSTVSTTEYNLGRHFRSLTAKVGLTDDSDNTAKVLFEVLVDGRKVSSRKATLGKPFALDVDVTGVLRLQIDATIVNTTCPGGNTAVVWGDAQLFGTPDEVPEPTDTSTPTDEFTSDVPPADILPTDEPTS